MGVVVRNQQINNNSLALGEVEKARSGSPTWVSKEGVTARQTWLWHETTLRSPGWHVAARRFASDPPAEGYRALAGKRGQGSPDLAYPGGRTFTVTRCRPQSRASSSSLK